MNRLLLASCFLFFSLFSSASEKEEAISLIEHSAKVVGAYTAGYVSAIDCMEEKARNECLNLLPDSTRKYLFDDWE